MGVIALAFVKMLVAGSQVRGSEFIKRTVWEGRLSANLDFRAWQASLNGGTVRKNRSLDELVGAPNSNRFPYILTQPDMLPKEGDWVVSVDFLPLAVAQHGVGFSLRNTETGHDLFRVLIDREQGAIQLWGGDGEYEVKQGLFWDGKAVKVKIKDNLTCDRWQVRKTADRMTLLFDGRTLSELVFEPGQYVLRIGSTQNVAYKPGEWSRMAFGTIRIDYLTAVPPVWIR